MRLIDAARSVKWWFTSVLGDHDYERYVAHMHARHPGTPVVCERDYWRERHADAELNPRSRCC